MKHRLFRYLVEHKGFTAIAFELSLPEAEVINQYVLHGTGDPMRVLGAAYFWIYNTEEVLELIEWMRAYNAEPGRTTKVQFLGFDMQFSEGADARLFEYLRRVDPPFAASARQPLTPLFEQATSRGAGLSADEQAGIAAGLARIQTRLEEQRAAYVAASSEAAWSLALRDATVLAQLTTMLGADPRSARRALRDKSMADNVLWHLEQQPAGGRIALWAHDMHLMRGDLAPDYPSQGTHLAAALGDDYRNLGFVFHTGSFQAYDYTGGDNRGVREFRADAGPVDDRGYNFARLSAPVFLLDLRPDTHSGPASAWLSAEHPRKVLGSAFLSQSYLDAPGSLARQFDGVIFIDEISRARPLHDRGWRYRPASR